YEWSTRELIVAAASGEISLKNANRDLIREASKQSKSKAEFALICKEAGVKGYEKYAELLYLQTRSMYNIAKNNPDLRKISRSEAKELIGLDLKNTIGPAFQDK